MFYHSDTIKIKEVVITRKKPISDPSGFRKITIDSETLKNYSHRSLADILSEISQISVKSYGMGGIATPSLRGTGASHTQISWNSIIINHPMLGQSDLATIPSGLIDDIQIYSGGSSMILNSGGIGGIINLETKPVWEKKTSISINPGFGSFGQYTGLIKINSGNTQFQTVTKVFLQSSENDFRYLNNVISAEPVWETRKNSQVNQKGFIQELYYRKSKDLLSARIWYQSANRNLPSSMLSQQINSEETQFDESLRSMFNYDVYRGRTSYFLTGAFMLSRLNYFNRLVEIDSRNLSESLILKAGIESRISENIKLKVELDNELNVVKSNNYDQNETQNINAVTASVERQSIDRIGAMILIREIIDNNTFLIPDFATGIQLQIFDEREYYLKANVSRNSKVPTMNERFWVPGGNPELKNEYAYLYELSYEMKQRFSSSDNTFKCNLSFFRNNIKDMIQWRPGEFSYWTADNIQNVKTMGFESAFAFTYTVNKLISVFNAGYTYTRATHGISNDNNDRLTGKQLMYIPENQANTSLRLSYRNIYSSWVTNMTGRRYIAADNSIYLPGYFLNNVSTGIKLNIKHNSIDMTFNIDNLFNVTYQTIAYYPLPRRSYFVKILFLIIK